MRIFDEEVPSGLSYWLVTMDPDLQSPDVKVFREWMLEELAGTSQGADGAKQRIFGKLRPRRRNVFPHRRLSCPATHRGHLVDTVLIGP